MFYKFARLYITLFSYLIYNFMFNVKLPNIDLLLVIEKKNNKIYLFKFHVQVKLSLKFALLILAYV